MQLSEAPLCSSASRLGSDHGLGGGGTEPGEGQHARCSSITTHCDAVQDWDGEKTGRRDVTTSGRSAGAAAMDDVRSRLGPSGDGSKAVVKGDVVGDKACSRCLSEISHDAGIFLSSAVACHLQMRTCRLRLVITDLLWRTHERINPDL